MFRNKSVLFIVCFILLIVATIGSTIALIIVKSDDILNVFRPQDPIGDLLITKNVTHPYGDTYQIPGNISFTYRIELGMDYAGKTIETSAGPVVADETGVIHVTVKPGLTAAIYGIPTDKIVTITETDILPGFAPEDGPVRTVTIPKRTEVSVVYNNIYTPAPAVSNLTLTGTKELEGRPWQEGDSFSFSLEAKGDDWTELGTATVTYDPNVQDFNSFNFTDLLAGYGFSHAGTYSFRISEKAGSIGGISYDPTVSYIDVTVTDADMNGALEITKVNASQNASVTATEKGYDVTVTIRNAYAPAGSAEAVVDIQKILNDLSGQDLQPEGYTFQLTDGQGNVVATSDPTSAAGETAIKLVYEAIDAGKQFAYTLSEVSGTRPGMTYDQTQYNLLVDVIDNLDGTIRAEVSLADPQQTTPESFTFTNTYDPADASVQISGMKYLEGREMVENEFTFHLYATGTNFQIPEDAQPLLSSGNGLQGGFGFAHIDYDKVGVYRYAVVEDASAAKGGIVYDDSVFYVTVTVTDEDGTLVARMEITDVFGTSCNAVFYNTYTTKPISVILEGQKKLNGGVLTAEQFTFKLFAADENYKPAEELLSAATNLADGQIRFDPITYTAPGDYYYVVLEDSSTAVPGMTYDESIYGIYVKVTDDLNGKLDVQIVTSLRVEKEEEQTVTGEDGTVTVEKVVVWEPVDVMVFENTYVEPPTEPSTEPTTETTTPGGTDDPVSPPTGDDSNPGLFIALLAGSGVILIGLVAALFFTKSKKKKDEE